MEAIQEALVSRVAEEHRHHGKAQFYWVWMFLLIITGIEVYLAYMNMASQPVRMLAILMGLSVLKAGLIIAYFMHMKFEASRMRWMTMTALVACLVFMTIFLIDAFCIIGKSFCYTAGS